MLLAIWIRLAPSKVSRKVGQENLPAISQATTPPSMTGTKVACKNGTRIALSHNPMKGGFFASTLGLDDISRLGMRRRCRRAPHQVHSRAHRDDLREARDGEQSNRSLRLLPRHESQSPIRRPWICS